jgi:cytochrome c553
MTNPTMIRSFLLSFGLAVCASATFADGIVGDPKAGEGKIAMCIGCHGIPNYQASFPQVHKVPMISGQTAPYIASALVAYRKGDRKHPTMRAIAVTLSDQDIADIAAFYEQHGSPAREVPAVPAAAPSGEVAALLAKGACASCHGANYNQPISPTYPKIAGQHGDYLYAALRAYRNDPSSAVIGRNNAIMGAQIQQFSNAELRAMAQYLASLPGDVRTVPQSRFR